MSQSLREIKEAADALSKGAQNESTGLVKTVMAAMGARAFCGRQMAALSLARALGSKGVRVDLGDLVTLCNILHAAEYTPTMAMPLLPDVDTPQRQLSQGFTGIHDSPCIGVWRML